jgi:twitching motility protein PilT
MSLFYLVVIIMIQISNANTLQELDFDSIFIPLSNPDLSVIYPGPLSPSISLSEDITQLTQQGCQMHKEKNSSDFLFIYNNIRLRCHYMPTVNGPYLILRKMQSELINLKECGFDDKTIEQLTSKRLSSGGIVVISGMPGNGKSTTSAALISERLKIHSGLCVTIEDPAEMPLQQMHGQGLCLQRNISAGESFSEAMRDSMRAYPAKVNNIMLIGEVRDGETASLALNSAVDGRLIIITTHAGNIAQTIHRIVSQASEVMSEDLARSLLASGLKTIIHQKIMTGKLYYSTLFDTTNACAIIRNKTVPIESINGEIEAQRIRTQKGMPLDLR